MSAAETKNPAEIAAEKAWDSLSTHLTQGASFVFEAGAGAGKTYSLIAALKLILHRDARELARRRQQVACITFTNVARDTIIEQTDSHPAIYCDTTHAFAWRLISSFQKRICEIVPSLPGWQSRTEQLNAVTVEGADYALGRRGIDGQKVLLHHDDIFPIFVELMNSQKFRNTLTSQFPIILIDEYQDTDASLMASFERHLLGRPGSPQIGLFGDHWQKIYGEGCGSIASPALKRVEKKANFRSAGIIVDCLNKVRPDLTQAPRDPSAKGSVAVFHTNSWPGKRQTRNHWQGDLPPDVSDKALKYVKGTLAELTGWNFDVSTKVLMLTQRAIANEGGYPSLPGVFEFKDSFTRKSNEVIAYFSDHLEPAVEAFLNKRYGAMFQAIDARRPIMSSPAEKVLWASTMRRVCDLRTSSTVGSVIEFLQNCTLPILSDKVVLMEKELSDAKKVGEELPRRLKELEKLHSVNYSEIIALCRYLRGHSPFETKHGVKGDQFDNVLVVFGRGWNDYNFNRYLEMAAAPNLIVGKEEEYERYRNLFYVAISRPKVNLGLLFTQRLSSEALETLSRWFGADRINDIGGELAYS